MLSPARKRNVLEKLAAARWRSLVRMGQATPGQLQGLKQMGLWGTSGSMAKETAGLAKGNDALIQRMGVTLDDTAPAGFGGWARGQAWQQPASFYKNPAELASARKDGLVAAGEQPTVSAPTIHVEPRNRTSTPSELVLRHELDEMRALGRLGKKEGSPFRFPDTSLNFYGHASPRVIAEEAGHANFLAPTPSSRANPMNMSGREMFAMNAHKQNRPTSTPAEALQASHAPASGMLTPGVGRTLSPQAAQFVQDYRSFPGYYYGMRPGQRAAFDQAMYRYSGPRS